MRFRSARKRSRNRATGGNVPRCRSDGDGRLGRQAAERDREQPGILLRQRRGGGDRRERRGADAEPAVALARQPLLEPERGGADAAVGGEPLGQLVGGLLGLEILEVGLGAEELAGLQLEQRRDEHEELAAGLEVELVALGEPLDERGDDLGDGHVGQLELLPEDQRQEQVERALKGIKVERKVTNDDPGHAGDANRGDGRGPWGWPSCAAASAPDPSCAAAAVAAPRCGAATR